MNAVRRKNLQEAIDLIDRAKAIIEDARDEEQECFDNLSENLQCSERGKQFEDNADLLDDLMDDLDDVIYNIDDIIRQ